MGRGASPLNERVKVLFLGGYSRSGSTLFDRMLGQIDGFTSTGELAYIWTHGLQENRLCGCGARFLECPFWGRVGEEAFGGWHRVDLEEMVALYGQVNRHRFLPLLLMPRLSSTYQRRLRAYGEVLARLYWAIGRASNSRVIVDSSIDPAYGFLLRHVPGVDLRILHFVRDSRGTAFSWTKHVVRSDVVDRSVRMRRFRPWVTALRWNLYHVLVHVLARIVGRAVTVRYEDMVLSPAEQIARAARHLGEDIAGQIDLGRFRPGVFDLDVNHTAAGNRVRLQTGRLPVRIDDEWRTRMPARDRALVTLLSWPLLRHYGYLRARARQATRPREPRPQAAQAPSGRSFDGRHRFPATTPFAAAGRRRP